MTATDSIAPPARPSGLRGQSSAPHIPLVRQLLTIGAQAHRRALPAAAGERDLEEPVAADGNTVAGPSGTHGKPRNPDVTAPPTDAARGQPAAPRRGLDTRPAATLASAPMAGLARPRGWRRALWLVAVVVLLAAALVFCLRSCTAAGAKQAASAGLRHNE
jgi:hypothetical protein